MSKVHDQWIKCDQPLQGFHKQQQFQKTVFLVQLIIQPHERKSLSSLQSLFPPVRFPINFRFPIQERELSKTGMKENRVKRSVPVVEGAWCHSIIMLRDKYVPEHQNGQRAFSCCPLKQYQKVPDINASQKEILCSLM